MIVAAKFDLGDVVYHRAPIDRERGIVTGLLVRPTGVLYYVTWANKTECSHFEIELTSEYRQDFGEAS